MLSGHFVPFRSNAWAGLPRNAEAAAFGLRLWRWALATSRAGLFICIGKTVAGDGIASVLGARPLKSMPSGWGSHTIDRYETPDGRRVVALPHLGRFRLFGDPRRDRLFLDAIGQTPRPVAAPAAPVQLSASLHAVSSRPATPLAAAPLSGDRMVLRGPSRPAPGTVWSIVCDKVDLSGTAETTLLQRLAAVRTGELPPNVRANPSVQAPGSARWWKGYLAGCLRRGYLRAG